MNGIDLEESYLVIIRGIISEFAEKRRESR
jgi:hypothetical protein